MVVVQRENHCYRRSTSFKFLKNGEVALRLSHTDGLPSQVSERCRGRVANGHNGSGNKVIFRARQMSEGKLNSIEMHHEEIPEATPGDNVGSTSGALLRRILSAAMSPVIKDTPPSVARNLRPRSSVLQHPSAITAGYTPVSMRTLRRSHAPSRKSGKA